MTGLTLHISTRKSLLREALPEHLQEPLAAPNLHYFLHRLCHHLEIMFFDLLTSPPHLTHMRM